MSIESSKMTGRPAELAIETAEAGILALQENARRLANDARLLLLARRHVAAAGLAATALGEITRTPILLELAHARSERQIRHCWSRFRAGSSEFPWSLFRADEAVGDGCLSDADMNRMLSFIESAATRVGCLGQSTWTSPSEVITRELAEEVVRLAELFSASPPEIKVLRVWLDVVGSFPKNTHDGDILDCFKERLDAEGLSSHTRMIDLFRERADARFATE